MKFEREELIPAWDMKNYQLKLRSLTYLAALICCRREFEVRGIL